MVRAIPLSIALHAALFLALSTWLSLRLVAPADNPLPLINFRLSPIHDSNLAEQENDRDGGNQDPATAANEIIQSELVNVEPEPILSPDRRWEPPPPAPAVNPSGPATTSLPPPQQEEVRLTPENVAATAAATQPSAELTITAPSGQIVPVNDIPAAPRKTPMSPDQERMLSKKLKKWTENFYRMTDQGPSMAWQQNQQQYTATFKPLPAADDTGIERVTVEVSTEENGTRMSTEMRLRRLSFSNFAQFVDRWDPSVQIHDDELDGRFHSNSEISVLSDRKVKPRFHGKVTTASRRVNLANSRGRAQRKAIFAGGLETGVKRIRLPKKFLPFPEGTKAQPTHMQRFNADARITFYGDGSYGWQPVKPAGSEEMGRISEPSTYLFASKGVKLHVKGTVKGKVLVHSPERIIIEGDLVYADYPEVGPASGNYLGLVSDKSVEIAEPAMTGPGDLRINAAIYAKRRFLVKRYRARENATLLIYGSLTAGSVSATEPRYSTRIQFDERLENIRPPSFPMSDRYELEAWDGEWTIASKR